MILEHTPFCLKFSKRWTKSYHTVKAFEKENEVKFSQAQLNII